MNHLKVDNGFLFCNSTNINGKKILAVTESALIDFSDYVENFSSEKVFKDGNVLEFIEGNTFKIAGIQFGDEDWHYIKITDKQVNVVINSEVTGLTLDLGTEIKNDRALEEDFQTKKQSIKTYVMIDTTNNLYKIGKSVNPIVRERTLQSEKPTIELYLVCNSDIENILHFKYKNKRVRGEWFSLTQDDLIDLVLEHEFEKI